MVLLNQIAEIFGLAQLNFQAGIGIGAVKGSRIGAALVSRPGEFHRLDPLSPSVDQKNLAKTRNQLWERTDMDERTPRNIVLCIDGMLEQTEQRGKHERP